jgi:hypothetical protein
MFDRYAEFCRKGDLTIGKLHLYKTPNKWILNFPTKRHWRGPSRLEWVETGLQRFVDTYAARGITSISFPQLGCGNGRLAWRDVGPLMERYLQPLPIPVFIHMRANSTGFIAEHEAPEEIATFSAPREQIGFEQFLRDVLALAGRSLIECESDSDEEPAPLPPIPLTKEVEVRGEDLENLWHRLTQRGALELTAKDIPGQLATVVEELAELLLRLRYIRRMTFIARDGGCGTAVRGLRLSPPARKDNGPLFGKDLRVGEVVPS